MNCTVKKQKIYFSKIQTKCIDILSSKQGVHLINSMQLAVTEVKWTCTPIRLMTPELKKLFKETKQC